MSKGTGPCTKEKKLLGYILGVGEQLWQKHDTSFVVKTPIPYPVASLPMSKGTGPCMKGKNKIKIVMSSYNPLRKVMAKHGASCGKSLGKVNNKPPCDTEST